MKHDEEAHVARCLECGDEIAYGRPDRKFCSITCKNRYNNKKTHDNRNAKRKVIHALDKNYEILDHLLKVGLREMDIIDIRHLGFHTEYMTSCNKTRTHTEYCCFDIRYHLTPTRVASIFRMEPPLMMKKE